MVSGANAAGARAGLLHAPPLLSREPLGSAKSMSSGTDETDNERRIDALIAAVREVVPYSGSVAALYDGLIRPQLEKRGHEFLTGLFDRLLGIERDTGKLDLENLLRNHDFAAFVTNAANVAARTRGSEKMAALRNAVLNVALGTTAEQDLQDIFLRSVENLTPSHLRLLKFLQAPGAAVQALNVATTPSPPMFEQAMVLVFPDQNERPEFYRQLYNDLVASGFALATSALGGAGNSRLLKRTSPFGDQFLLFVSDPAQQEGAAQQGAAADRQGPRSDQPR